MDKITHLSSGAVVFAPSEGIPVVLIQARRHSGMFWGLPKGHIGLGETLVQAAIRETEEETGLDVSSLRLVCYLRPVFYEFLTRNGGVEKLNCKTVHFFLLEAPAGLPPMEAKFGDEGIKQVEWFPLAQAKEQVTFSNYRTVLESAEKALHLR
jgi:bis(5'-nucleosidyl)-tetraphosphatase